MTDETAPRLGSMGAIQTAIEELSPALCRTLLLCVLAGVITVEEAKEALADHHDRHWEKRGWRS